MHDLVAAGAENRGAEDLTGFGVDDNRSGENSQWFRATLPGVERGSSIEGGCYDVGVDRNLAESVLDTLEIFIDDFEIARGGKPREKRPSQKEPQVTRLN